MILVTLGTQQQSFKRLLDYIESSNIEGEIIVQAGNTKYKSNKMIIKDYFAYDEMQDLIAKADLIITHGGTGSVIEPLKKGKKVIACVRLKKYNEHVDDHQQELVQIFASEGYILELNEAKNLNELLTEVSNFQPKKFVSNNENFVEKLLQKI